MMRWPNREGLHFLGISALLLVLLTVLGAANGSMQHPPPQTVAYGHSIVVNQWDWTEMQLARKLPKTFTAKFTMTPLLKESSSWKDGHLAPVYSQVIKVNPSKETEIMIDEVLDHGLYQMAFTVKDFGRESPGAGSESASESGKYNSMRKRDVGEAEVTVKFLRPVLMYHGDITVETTDLYKKEPLMFSFLLEESLKAALGDHLIIRMHPVMVLDEDSSVEVSGESDLPFLFADNLQTASDKYFMDSEDPMASPPTYEMEVDDELFAKYSGQSFFLAVYAMARGHTFSLNHKANGGAILLLTSNPFKLHDEELLEDSEEGTYIPLDFSPDIDESRTSSTSRERSSSKVSRSHDSDESSLHGKAEKNMFIQRPSNILFRTRDIAQLPIMGWDQRLGLKAKRFMMQRPMQNDPIVVPDPEVSPDGLITCYISNLFGPGTYAAKLECFNGLDQRLDIGTSKAGIHITNKFVVSPCQGERCQLQKLDLIFDGLQNTELLQVNCYTVTLVAQGLSRTPGDDPTPLPLTNSYVIPAESTNVFKDGYIHLPLNVSRFPRKLLNLTLMTIQVLAHVTRKDPIEETEWTEVINLALSDNFSLCESDKTGGSLTCPVSVSIGSKSRLVPRPVSKGQARSWDLHNWIVAPCEWRRQWRQAVELSIRSNKKGLLKRPPNGTGELRARGRLSPPPISGPPLSPRTDLAVRLGNMEVRAPQQGDRLSPGSYSPVPPNIQITLGRGPENRPHGLPKNPSFTI